MSIGKILIKILKYICFVSFALIVCIVVYISHLSIGLRERTLFESPASSVVENDALELKSHIVLRHHFTGGLGGESFWGWYLIIENNKGEQFESKIPFQPIPNKTNDEEEINSLKARKFEINWDNRYKLSIKSADWPTFTSNAYFISNCLHVFDKESDTFISSINKDIEPLSKEFLKKLELLNLDKDALNKLMYIDLSDYDQRYGAIISEEANVLLYLKNNTNLTWVKIFAVGPVLFEGECPFRTVASSQWVFFNDSFLYDNEVYANQIFLKNSEGKLKAIHTTPIVLKDKE